MGIGELLDRDNGFLQKLFAPLGVGLGGKIAVNAAVGHGSVIAQLIEDPVQVFIGYVVGIDEEGKLFVFHNCFPFVLCQPVPKKEASLLLPAVSSLYIRQR